MTSVLRALSAGSLALFSLLAGCRSAPSGAVPPPLAVPADVTAKPYLYEVVRYLYRWQFTEEEVERIVGSDRLTVWARRLDLPLDAGDRSVLAEILLPQVGLRVTVKQADYRIEETGTEVKSPSFRIVRVLREPPPPRPPREAAVVALDMRELRDYLFRTRAQHDFPSPALIRRLQEAVRKEAAREGRLPAGGLDGEKVIHIAPLSPVANEVWVYWEAGRKLILFASDIDLANPAVWEQETLSARLYDLDEQVIVSPQEAPGSNRFLTRYQVSRALFNCLLFGQRLTVRPPEAAAEARK
jgi:hypothetical protein